MESKYQVVSIKENPFQRAGDVTFRGPSPSFTLPDFLFFLCSFLSSPLPPSLSVPFFPVLILRWEKPSFPWGGFWIAALDQTLLKERFRAVECSGPSPALSSGAAAHLSAGEGKTIHAAVFLSVELGLVCLILVYMWKWKGCGSFISRFPNWSCSKQGERLDLCHGVSLFSFFLLESMLLSLPPGEICCLSQFLSFLVEFQPLPYRWIVTLPLFICFTCSSLIPSPKVASFLLYILGVSPHSSTSLLSHLFLIIDAICFVCGLIWKECFYSNCKSMGDQWDIWKDKMKLC